MINISIINLNWQVNQHNFFKVSLSLFLSLPCTRYLKNYNLKIGVLYSQEAVTQNMNKILKSIWNIKGGEEAESDKSERNPFSNPCCSRECWKYTRNFFSFPWSRSEPLSKRLRRVHTERSTLRQAKEFLLRVSHGVLPWSA